MLGQLGPTQFDLRFHLFGIPVMVHPAFWILGVLFGWVPNRLDLVVLNVGCIFVSILVHELGHALFQRRWGDCLYIQLHMFGGVAAYIPGPGTTPFRSIVISLAGPIAGFLLAAFSFGVMLVLSFSNLGEQLANFPKLLMYLEHALLIFIFINIVWGIFNLLPILPLDGGHVSQEVCQLITRRGQLWTYRISIITALCIVVFLAQFGSNYQMAIFWCCYLGYQNWLGLNQLTGRNW